jgi:DNA mismatch repair protein MutS
VGTNSSMSATTRPMYQKYYEAWASHAATYGPRTALLYQVGGFFEIYDTENLTTGTTKANIREIAELCQLSLTQHEVGDSCEQTLFGGFPEGALSKFEKILVQAGWTVVVVVQMKDKKGAVQDRVVDHISSPGCFADGSVKERRLVGCVVESMGGPSALQKIYWSVAALDLATGRIWFAEGGSPDRLHQFLCMHPPAELVIWSDGLPASNTLTDSLKTITDAVHIKCLGPASAAVDEATLERFWPLKRLATWISKAPSSRRCLAALMAFAGDHVPSALRSLEEPELWVPDGEVRLGNAALEQLGLVSLRSEKEGLLGLMDKCRSVAGRRLLRSRLLRPISDIGELERRLDRIAAAAGRDPVPTERGLRSLYDISRLWRRVELGTATMNDMGCLLRSYEAARALGSCGSALFDWVAARWDTAATVEIARDSTGTPVKKLPFITGAYPVIEELFAEGIAIRSEAEALCELWSSGLTGSKGKEQLYLDDAEGGGFRMTGTKRRINAVLTVLRDEGDKSAQIVPYKTTSLLETAGLAAISTRHRAWMHRWAPAWTAAWSAALAELVSFGRGITAEVEAWCADLDVSWTVAGIAAEWKWVRPVFVAAAVSTVEVTGLRHPMIERLVKVPYVSHSIDLTETHGLLLYGMNASGKSSLMKALGLSVLLAQAGFPVPATSLRLAPFTAIFTRILGNDNLWAGLSSFAVEMTEFREILQFADEHSLVLGDELCSGTESLSATALVAAGVETLAERGTKFVFATHLHELAGLVPSGSVTAVHLKVHYDASTDTLVYDRSLAPGSGSALYGLEVCRALDLPAGYLDRATTIRKQLAGWVAPHRSAYSADAVIDKCGVCGSSDGLEAHHIVPQKDSGSHTPGNLVCLCAKCHDDHHGGRLVIDGWEETSGGRRLRWSRPTVDTVTDEVMAWIKEQRLMKVRVPTIQRMAKQIFGVSLSISSIKKE